MGRRGVSPRNKEFTFYSFIFRAGCSAYPDSKSFYISRVGGAFRSAIKLSIYLPGRMPGLPGDESFISDEPAWRLKWVGGASRPAIRLSIPYVHLLDWMPSLPRKQLISSAYLPNHRLGESSNLVPEVKK
jgi:hypothetical protein